MRTAVTLCSLALATVLLGSSGIARADENYLMVTVASEPQSAAKTLQAQVTIDAPPTMVWQALTDYPQLKNILGYEKSSVIKSSGATKVLDVAMKVAAFLPTYKYQVQVREVEPNRLLKFERISGDFRSMSASYKLVPQANGKKTLVMYNLSVDTGKNVPGSQGILKANTEKSLKALEKHVEDVARRSVIGAN